MVKNQDSDGDAMPDTYERRYRLNQIPPPTPPMTLMQTVYRI